MKIYLKEIHRMLSKWNKNEIRQYLQTCTLFDFVDRSPTPSIIGSEINKIKKKKLLNNSEYTRCDDDVTQYLKYAKKENADEILAISVNVSKGNDDFKKMFAISKSGDSTFPDSVAELPTVFFPYKQEIAKIYENLNYFGDHYQLSIAMDGMSALINNVLEKIGTLKLNYVCTKNVIRDNYFEPIINGLLTNKLVIFEQYERNGQVETIAQIISRTNPDFFMDVPIQFLESNILLYYIYK